MVPAAPPGLLQMIPRLCESSRPRSARVSWEGQREEWHFLVPRTVTASRAAGAGNQHGRSVWKGQVWDRNWEYPAPGGAGHSGTVGTQSTPGSRPGSAAPQELPRTQGAAPAVPPAASITPRVSPSPSAAAALRAPAWNGRIGVLGAEQSPAGADTALCPSLGCCSRFQLILLSPPAP